MVSCISISSVKLYECLIFNILSLMVECIWIVKQKGKYKKVTSNCDMKMRRGDFHFFHYFKAKDKEKGYEIKLFSMGIIKKIG